MAREAWAVKFDAKVVASFTDAHLARAVKIVGISDDLSNACPTALIVRNIAAQGHELFRDAN